MRQTYNNGTKNITIIQNRIIKGPSQTNRKLPKMTSSMYFLGEEPAYSDSDDELNRADITRGPSVVDCSSIQRTRDVEVQCNILTVDKCIHSLVTKCAQLNPKTSGTYEQLILLCQELVDNEYLITSNSRQGYDSETGIESGAVTNSDENSHNHEHINNRVHNRTPILPENPNYKGHSKQSLRLAFQKECDLLAAKTQSRLERVSMEHRQSCSSKENNVASEINRSADRSRKSHKLPVQHEVDQSTAKTKSRHERMSQQRRQTYSSEEDNVADEIDGADRSRKSHKLPVQNEVYQPTAKTQSRLGRMSQQRRQSYSSEEDNVADEIDGNEGHTRKSHKLAVQHGDEQSAAKSQSRLERMSLQRRQSCSSEEIGVDEIRGSEGRPRKSHKLYGDEQSATKSQSILERMSLQRQRSSSSEDDDVADEIHGSRSRKNSAFQSEYEKFAKKLQVRLKRLSVDSMQSYFSKENAVSDENDCIYLRPRKSLRLDAQHEHDEFAAKNQSRLDRVLVETRQLRSSKEDNVANESQRTESHARKSLTLVFQNEDNKFAAQTQSEPEGVSMERKKSYLSKENRIPSEGYYESPRNTDGKLSIDNVFKHPQMLLADQIFTRKSTRKNVNATDKVPDVKKGGKSHTTSKTENTDATKRVSERIKTKVSLESFKEKTEPLPKSLKENTEPLRRSTRNTNSNTKQEQSHEKADFKCNADFMLHTKSRIEKHVVRPLARHWDNPNKSFSTLRNYLKDRRKRFPKVIVSKAHKLLLHQLRILTMTDLPITLEKNLL